MNDDDIVREFLIECHEGLDQLDQLLVELEEHPGSRERLASIFRLIHTIKGTSGFLSFHKLEAVTHVGESLLSRLRDGELRLDGPRTDVLLAMVTAIRKMLAEIESTGADASGDYAQLIADITALTQSDRPAAGRSATPRPAPVPSVAPRRTAPPQAMGEKPVSVKPASVKPATAPAPSHRPSHRPASVSPPRRTSMKPEEAGAEARKGASDLSIRIDVQLLDRLMNLVGELVLARNQVLQFTGGTEDPSLVATSQRLNLVTTELQEGIMKTRMQPIGTVWSKYPRIVRDLAAACGKQIRLVMDGMETELDRSILEAIKDPLTHIVRNSADHGIEPPDLRVAVGKPSSGTLRLRAFHEGGKVNIEVSDDGRGIDTDKVREKALVRGLVTPERAAAMSERELLNLIFLPGFSTADKVSNVSGRGVGMDVVKTNVERIGGTIDLQSRKGHGTTLRIRIPLTLAIVPALMISCAGDRYAIPQVNLLELVRLEAEQARGAIDEIYGTQVLRLRGELMPLVRLRDVLGVRDGETDDHINIVVLSADERVFGLVVDEISDTKEIVVKPLGASLKGIGAYAGATILGDGHIALILDVLGVAERAGLRGDARGRAANTNDRAARDRDALQRLLVFQSTNGERSAIPIDRVARLEEINARAIERAGRDEVVQYRGEILPIVRLGGGSGRADNDDATMQVVVCNTGERSVGLVVRQIDDIVEQAVELYPSASRGPRVGCAVVQGEVTSLLDVASLVSAAGIDIAPPRRAAQGGV